VAEPATATAPAPVAAPAPAAGAELLLEVRCEEIPARMLEGAAKELATRVFEELMGRGLPPREVETGFTPRRLVLVLKGLPAKAADVEELVTGPPVTAAFGADGAPTKAALGFAQRLGLAPEALERVRTEKGEYLAGRRHTPGQTALAVAAEVLPRVLLGISWAKTMKWGSGIGPWVRPLHGIVALLDGEVVPMELFGVAAGRQTAGHPTLSPEPFAVTGSADYRTQLAARGIEVRFETRCRRLAEEMGARAAAHGGSLVEDSGLLAKLGAICEIPGVLEGAFDPALLALPREVLGTSLRDHQSAFTVEKDGAMLPLFLTVMDRADDPAGRVRAGNEWVVAARLADARFFWEEDRKVPLTERVERLAHLTFHEKLGSYLAKAERLASLAAAVCAATGWDGDEPHATTAARLLKADLTTEMVKEFTSLQGVMGGIYARAEGHPEPVWQAIYDQYLPAAPDDRIPRGRAGIACGIADRVDTLVGMFGLGLVPTGTKDPFGLRRAAQGVLRILLEADLPLLLEPLVRRAATLYGERLKRSADQIVADLAPFVADRVRYLLGRHGLAYDEIEAALAVGPAGGERPLPDLLARARALHEVRGEREFLAVVLAAKRIANITKGQEASQALDAAALQEPAEQALHAAHVQLAATVESAVAGRDYAGALRAIASLADVLERFFVEVMVMAEDPAVRRNRVALLQGIGATLSRVAGLTEMVVEKAEYR
jgi:glycyl-tRNA synthetase beta chain